MENERRRLGLPSPATVIACIALAVALGGTGYAAVSLPKGSVGTPQLKKNAVTGKKVKNRSLTAADLKRGTLFGTSTVVTGVDFRPQGSATTYDYANGGAIRRLAGTDFFIATPDLPHGAVVNRVVFYVVDNSINDLALEFVSYNPSGKSEIKHISTTSSALPSSSSVQAFGVEPATPFVIDRSTRAYHVRVSVGVSTTAHQIVGARIEYALP